MLQALRVEINALSSQVDFEQLSHIMILVFALLVFPVISTLQQYVTEI